MSFKRTTGFLTAFYLTWTVGNSQFFIARCFRAPFPATSTPSWGAQCGTGVSCSSEWDLHGRDIPPNYQLPQGGVELAHFMSPTPYQSLCGFFFISCYWTSVQLYFRWSSRLIILKFSGNFNMVMRRSKQSNYLLHYLESSNLHWLTLKIKPTWHS